MIRLSVIIVAYNCYEYLKNCIYSIYRYNDIGDKLEVIVVDNGDDCSCERIASVPGFGGVIAFKHDNTGFGAGNNAGAKIAKGDILLFLNPDTVLVEPVFSFCLDKFDYDTKLGCFGVQLVDKNMQPAPSGGFRLQMGFWKTQSYMVLDKLGIFIPRYMFTSGADMFIRKDAFFECGAFDENLFMYCEEPDICNRLNLIGKKVAYFPEKRIIHNEGGASADSFSQKYSAVLKSRKYYCEKYGINFKREAEKELRYCRMKAAALKIMGRSASSDAYYKITGIIRNCISEGN